MIRVLLLATLLVACGTHAELPEPAVRGELSRPILDVSGAAGREPRDLLAEVAAANLQDRPVGRDVRPVELLEVLAVDELRLRTDRGDEHVRLLGVHGADPRLPESVNAWFDTTAKGELAAWLRDGQLVEHSLPFYGPRAAAMGPPPGLVDASGLRPITLARSTDEPGLYTDVATESIARGWSYAWHPVADYLASDRRWMSDGVERGFAELPASREALRAWRAEAQRIAAMPQAELQRLGDELLVEFAAWLEWTPANPLRFEPVDPDAARALLRQTIATHIEHERAAHQYFTDPLESRVEDTYARTNGYSPAGDTIYVFSKPQLSERQLRAVLVHEIAHQYQEELLPGPHFPPVRTPGGITEAHAELLSLRFREAHWPGFGGALAYPDDVDRLRALCDASGRSPDEVYQAYLDGEWDAGLFTAWHLFQMGEQEFLFRQLRGAVREGLAFRAGAGPGEVQITNTTDAGVHAQFHGEWLWFDSEDEVRHASGPPFNLDLDPGERVNLRVVVAEQPFGAELTGLFQHTRSP